MNKKTHRCGSSLSRWWWPGQWLRIVWGVLVDQAWYQHNVHILMSIRRQTVKIFLQGILGVALLFGGVSLIVAGILAVMGVMVDWGGYIKGIGASLLVIALLGLFALLTTNLAHPNILFFCVVLFSAGTVISFLVYGLLPGLLPSGYLGVAKGTVYGLFLGVAMGMSYSMISGKRLGVGLMILSLVVLPMVLIIVSASPEKVVAGFSASLGIWMGSLWAKRQTVEAKTD
jgi:hypothetical protein